jgi:hypothetical protein
MENQTGDRCRWIEHQGIRILFTDFRGLAADDYLPILDQAIGLIVKEAPHSVFTLSAHSRIHINDRLTAKTGDYATAAKGISKGTATFGLEGLQKVIAKSVKKDVFFAPSMEAALEWIREQNEKSTIEA